MDLKKKSLIGYISPELNAARVLSHGKIDSLENNFALPGNVPFSIFIVPKTETTEYGIAEILSVKLYQEDDASDCPFVVGAWNEPAIVQITAHETFLTSFDVYWGAGQKVEE